MLKEVDSSVCARLQSVLANEPIFTVDETCTHITFNTDLSPQTSDSGAGSEDGTDEEPQTPVDPCENATCPTKCHL